MKKTIIAGIFLTAIVLIAFILIGNYNSFVVLNEEITKSWSEVENQLQRRNDLIPNLVNTVKGFAKQEKEIFEKVTEARSKLIGAKTIAEKINANAQLETALSRLLAIAENYPILKSNENFIRLQDELAGTENRIAVARQRYNEAVKNYNTKIMKFPANLVGKIFGFQRKDIYFEAQQEAKTLPKVEF